MSNRRTFIKNAGGAFLPAFIPVIPAFGRFENGFAAPQGLVNFISDSEMLSPAEYITRLQDINNKEAIKPDTYGSGGPVSLLEKKFEVITGKQKAIYMPTGTMANQFAIAALSADNTKVFVQETSHVYRDEADAAQSVHNKRLIPLAKGEASFTLDALRSAIDYHNQGEVFKSGIGTVSIESPVRRVNGTQVPFEEMKKISGWCRENKIRLHLDGARLFLGSAYSGKSIKEYASLFDTVYISLYKYLGAAGGAILCGDAALIDSMVHRMKIFGGSVYRSWPNAAMALSYLDGFEERFRKAVEQSNQLFAVLNKLPELKIEPWPNGSNIFRLKFGDNINSKKFSESLRQKYNIAMSAYTEEGSGRLAVNESILRRSNDELLAAIKDSITLARQ